MKSNRFRLLLVLPLVMCASACAAPQDESKGQDTAMQDRDTAFLVWQPGVYARFVEKERPKPEGAAKLTAAACGNESVAFQLAAMHVKGAEDLRVACGALTGPGGAEISGDAWQAHFVEYVGAKEAGRVSDVLSEAAPRPLPAKTAQPIWLTLQVPAGQAAGTYSGQVEVLCDAASVRRFAVELQVIGEDLPVATKDRFYLDLWQHPGAIARYHEVELWSEPHWALIRAYTRLLAGAGQNPITACIIHDPWASQTYDAHPTMVEWVREADGSFSFDFTQFDRYVALCLEEGLPGPINCYSLAMGPGKRMDCPIRYWDANENRYKKLDSTVGDDTYQSVWRQFFAAFTPHLKEKGWFDNTCIAMDEAPEEKMQAMFAVLPQEYKVALAGNYHEALDERIHDYCVFYPGAEQAVAKARRARGHITTFYTCCGPAFPNTFAFSPPVESRLLGWIALQRNGDGYLRWAFASWPEAPLDSTDWGNWPAADTFVVYPGPRSSVRFELMKRGIQDFNAWHLAKDKAPDDPRLTEAIELANAEHNGRKFDPAKLEQARALVNAVLAE